MRSMQIRKLIRLVLIGLMGIAAAGWAHRVVASQPPNIILFLTDDMTWFDAGCYGNKDVKTPHLDRLASQGMRFTNCSTSTAMCAPTRQQLYTGLWPVRSGAYPNHSAVKAGTKSLGHHFANLGYRVAISGKKHYKPAASYPFTTLNSKQDKGEKGDVGPHAIKQFINQKINQPYFLICATRQPHAPWTRGDASAYDPSKLALPPYLADTPQTRRGLADYYAEITYADALLGEVMAAVDKAGQRDNTIVLFTSEQGSQLPFGKWTCYEAGLKTGLVVRWPGKVESGSTTDAIVQYVDIVPTLIEAAGSDPSKYDTGRAGAPDGGSGFDGKSFLNVLLGEAEQHRTYAYGIHTTRGIINGSDCYPIRSVRDKRYKLILNLSHESAFRNILMLKGRSEVWPSWVAAMGEGDQRAAQLVRRYQHRPAVELYDLEEDPFEMKNLGDDPGLADVRARLNKALKQWMAQQGDEGIATEMTARAK